MYSTYIGPFSPVSIHLHKIGGVSFQSFFYFLLTVGGAMVTKNELL